jgi:glycosyltransferase involved in cell wall biosynthesis
MFVIIPENIGSMGGTRTFVERLLALNRKNLIGSVLVLQDSNVDYRIENLVKELGFILFKVSNRNTFFYRPYLSFFYDFFIYTRIKLKYKPSLIFCSIGTPRLFLGLFFFKIPLIYFLHTIPNPNTWRTRSINLLSHLTRPNKFFVTVSNAAKFAMIDEMKIKISDIHVVHNSVTLPSFTLKKNHYQTFSVLTVGHVVDYKNPYIWFEVAKNVIRIFPNATFTWVGEGPLLDVMRKEVFVSGFSE